MELKGLQSLQMRTGRDRGLKINPLNIQNYIGIQSGNKILNTVSFSSLLNPFTLDFLKWTLQSMSLDISIVANWALVKGQKENSKQCRS